MKDILLREEILKNLDCPQKFNINIFDEIGSTNIYLKELVKNGADEGTIVIANSQTAGHGRFERVFYSPKDSGIYMSMLLKPDLTAEKSVILTVAAAVAVSDAIIKLTGLKPQIKWVNDILINQKKVCGILTEGAVNPKTLKFDWVVVGIGINVYNPCDDFDSSIKNIATSLLETPKQNFRNIFCAEIINRMYEFCENLNDKSFIEKYKEYSAIIGKKINVIKGDNETPAVAVLIDDDCRLKVQYDNGETELLNSGEISIKF